MQVDIDSQDIERAIIDAIIASSLGDSIKEMVQEVVDGLGKKPR